MDGCLGCFFSSQTASKPLLSSFPLQGGSFLVFSMIPPFHFSVFLSRSLLAPIFLSPPGNLHRQTPFRAFTRVASVFLFGDSCSSSEPVLRQYFFSHNFFHCKTGEPPLAHKFDTRVYTHSLDFAVRSFARVHYYFFFAIHGSSPFSRNHRDAPRL